MKVIEYQRRLAELGFDPGPVDGVRGRRTIAAIKAFQASRGLRLVDGLVGPETEAALFGETPSGRKAIANLPAAQSADATPWMDLAIRKKGLHEARDNRALWAWLKSGGGSVGDPAKIPWCGDFVETCIAVSLPEEPLPANPYWARNWAGFGRPCPPVYGAIASFKRGNGGHVGFVVAIDRAPKLRLQILGGNQSNAVTETWLDGDRLIATRWPLTALPHGGEIRAGSSAGAKLSTNEA